MGDKKPETNTLDKQEDMEEIDLETDEMGDKKPETTKLDKKGEEDMEEIDLETDEDYKGLSMEDFRRFQSEMFSLWLEENGGGQPMDLYERLDIHSRARIADWRKEQGL